MVRSLQDCVWPSRVGSWKDNTLVWEHLGFAQGELLGL